MATSTNIAEKLAELEARMSAIEKRKEQEMMFVQETALNGAAIYAVVEREAYEPCGARMFPLRQVVTMLCKKVGLRIVYTYPSGERIDIK